MPQSYEKFLEVKNRYCFLYKGRNEDYIHRLSIAIPLLKKEFSNVEFHVACREEFMNQFENVVDEKNINESDYGYVRKVMYNQIEDPIELFFTESELKIPDEVRFQK